MAHAKQTLATLMIADFPDHASLSVFFGALSISAFSLEASSSHQWYQQGTQYMSKAQENLKLALADTFSHTKKTKYKSLLMALLTGLQVSVSHPNRCERGADESSYSRCTQDLWSRLRVISWMLRS